MKLAEVNQTELECQRVNTGLTIIMRRGQMSITMIVNPESLESIIKELKVQLDIIRAFDDIHKAQAEWNKKNSEILETEEMKLGLTRNEIRKIANHTKVSDDT